MAENSAIEWTDATFNPWQGCTKVSPGCDHCYAEARLDRRLHVVSWGAGQARKRTSPKNWRAPEQWNKRPYAACGSCGWRGEASDCPNMGQSCPRCSGNVHSARRRVFCASLADVFDNEVPHAWRQELLSLIVSTPHLDWLLLTKRIGNARRMLSEASMHDGLLLTANDEYRPPANLWIGATIVNREEMLRDGAKLKRTPAAVRFWSVEPLLEDLGVIPRELMPDWVIVGGESGHGARPMHPDWARGLRDQCAAAGVPFLFKQWGEWMPIGQQGNGDGPGCSDFPGYAKAARCVLQLDGEIRDAWPAGAMLMRRIGKKAAGRLLDGREHNEFPRVSIHPLEP